MKTVLSLRGGGVRGIISLVFLNKIYNKHKFDLITGTSTGSIIAAGLSINMQPQEILDIYLKSIKNIFSNSIWYKIKSANGLLLPKYEDYKLEEMLKSVFGNIKLSETKIPFMCNAYNITKDEPVFFKSYKDNANDLYLWEVIKASCSAPTYFKNTNISGYKMVDGGISDNDMSLCGFIELKKLYNGEPVTVINVGTGYYNKDYNLGSEGLKDWATEIIPVVLNGNTTTPEYILKKSLTNSDVYLRYDKKLSYDMKLDDISQKAIDEMLREA